MYYLCMKHNTAGTPGPAPPPLRVPIVETHDENK